MKIVLAPNAFKESISAIEAARAMKRGLRRALPRAELIEMPVADGGDGTAEILRRAVGGTTRRYRVHGPLGGPVAAGLVRLKDREVKTAVIEMAQTSGLRLIPPRRRNPLRATTRGLGELIDIAIGSGVERIIIGLGGSGTIDGGAGMARAMGFKLLDGRGKAIPVGGGGLEHLERIIPPPQWEPRARGGRSNVSIIAACDVTNRLLGRRGAAPVFGPQKGATPAMVRRLEAGLANLARRFRADLGIDVRNLTGGGAAGGLGAGLVAFLGAELKPGAQLVLETIGFRQALRRADWVITGEGRIDRQTLEDKAPSVVARTAGGAGVPTIALGGEVSLEGRSRGGKSSESPFAACFSIAPGPISMEESREKTAELLERTCFELGGVLGG